ncbi:MAG: undecaprenyl-diphosphate phosphatase [Kiloniellales bacterium]|nr:undecaprenyl-diphosphate phosphatase [Kiloniellales bacterium]
MPLLTLVILAAVQGVTEFLPISSSGHLELTWRVMGDPNLSENPGLAPDSERLILFVAVHLGTLFAVALYFWRDVAALIGGGLRLLIGRGGPAARLAGCIVVGSLPLAAAGFLLKDVLLESLYNLQVIAWATIGFAVLLYLGDRLGMTVRKVDHLTLGGAFVLGLAQALALIPGTSRSGITMTAARFFGFERAEAARISLLLAIPAILGASLLGGLELYETGNLRLGRDAGLAAALAFGTALIAIALMMAWLRRASFTPFVIYRLGLGAVLLWWAYQEQITLALGL